MKKRLAWATIAWLGLIALPLLIDFTLRAFNAYRASDTNNLWNIDGILLFGALAVISVIPFGIAIWKQSKVWALTVMAVVAYLTTAAYPYIALIYACATGIGCV